MPTPTITGPAADALLNHGTVVLTGTAAPGSSVIVTFDNNPLPAVVVDASGVYSVTPNFTVGVGAHTFAVQATSGSTPLDVWSAVAGPRSFTMIDGCLDNTDCSGATPQCDTSAHTCVRCLGDNNCPGGATCAGQTCVLAAPVFVSPNANDLLSPQPTFTGTGPAGTTVTVTVDGNSVGQAGGGRQRYLVRDAGSGLAGHVAHCDSQRQLRNRQPWRAEWQRQQRSL